MRKRRHIPIRWVRKMLRRQAGDGTRPPTCAVKDCPVVLTLRPRRNFIIEHRQPRSRGGRDTLKNLELRCVPHADQKTFHPRSKATTIGGDNYEAKKTGRMKLKHAVTKSAGKTKPRTKRYPWPVGRPIVSRGFPKIRRQMRRTCTSRSKS